MESKVLETECLEGLQKLGEEYKESCSLLYIDPPFMTQKTQKLHDNSYEDKFKDMDTYLSYLKERIGCSLYYLSSNSSIFIHLDHHAVHHVKVMMDKFLGQNNFMNEIIWAYDYGGRAKKHWSRKHDNILWYVTNPKDYIFNYEEMDRIPYMAPGLVGPEKAARGKTPTDCFSEDTEILTENGWQSFGSLDLDTRIATIAPDKKLYYEKPVAIQEKEYNGDMVNIISRDNDILVTPDHLLYTRKYNEKEYKFLYAKDIKPNHYFLNSISEVGDVLQFDNEYFYLPKETNPKFIEKIKMKDWSEFMGFYLSEGSFGKNNSVQIAKSKKKKEQWNQVKNLLDRIGFYWKYNDKSMQFNIFSKQLMCYVEKMGKCNEKYIPQLLLFQKKEILEIFWNTLVSCDGHTRGNSQDYITTSKKLSNNIQELLFRIGYMSNIHTLDKEEGKKQQYRISKKVFSESLVKSDHIKRFQYKGKIYCVSLPSYHTVVIRRNGKLSICGQCWWHTIVPTNSKERQGYPTQKPLGILERIIKVHTNPGDFVMDFFAGTGTSAVAAKKHGRKYVAMDRNPNAVSIINRRLDEIY